MGLPCETGLPVGTVRGVIKKAARVGVAQGMTAAGFGLAEIMQAGRWKSPAMPARYSENQKAKRGAAA